MEERINPARITDHENGITYVLEFNRESVRFAEKNGFNIINVKDYSVTGSEDLFFYAFRMHHRNIARNQTDKLIQRWGGALPESLLLRLIDLYNQTANSNTIQMDEEAEKNTSLTLEL